MLDSSGSAASRNTEPRFALSSSYLKGKKGRQIWAEDYDRDLTLGNLFEVQSDIADRIASALQAALTPAERERIGVVPTENLDAYAHYLRGRYYFHQRTPDGLRRAREAYEEAIELDTTFAPAYSGLASVYTVSMLFDYRFLPDLHSVALRALSMADAALSLDPDLAEAYAARMYVKTFL